MAPMIKVGFLMMLAAAALGCGGDDGGGGGGGGTNAVTATRAQELCMASCEHESTCMTLGTDETVESCTTDCAGDVGGGGYRSDVVEATFACASATCDQTAEDCLTCTPTSAHEAYETACRAKAAECGAAQADIDNLCETTLDTTTGSGYLCIYTPAVVNALAACFDMDCAAIDPCFDQVATQYGLN